MADQKKPDSVCTRTRGKFGHLSENETLGKMTVYFQNQTTQKYGTTFTWQSSSYWTTFAC
jgi:hypothetical protein